MESVYVDITLSVCLCGSLFLFFVIYYFLFFRTRLSAARLRSRGPGSEAKSNHPRGHPCCRLLAAS